MRAIFLYFDAWLKKKKISLFFNVLLITYLILIIVSFILYSNLNLKTNNKVNKSIEIILYYIHPIFVIICTNLLSIFLFFAYKSYINNAFNLSDEEFNQNYKELKFPSYFNLFLINYVNKIDISLVNDETKKIIYIKLKRNNFMYLFSSMIITILVDIFFIVMIVNWFTFFSSVNELNNIFSYMIIVIALFEVILIFITKFLIIKQIKKYLIK
ncbi:hypothetical protein RRG43_00185 [Mycoplasmopsis cynos]|uniref:hypothetical protein n=1 Tax=Mycoplasmopsis cynos TaxID=171284 RepID=UPI002AFE5467|nr:hypothetical protein [Mycoplasmopsis cynos]WQQ15501.1 hypothetical protein RRG43_00185 [Mycoplasmopsis cynos]